MSALGDQLRIIADDFADVDLVHTSVRLLELAKQADDMVPFAQVDAMARMLVASGDATPHLTRFVARLKEA